MHTLDLAGLAATMPDDWNCQGMLTITLPSPDKRVKPNVILTKEYLPKPMELAEYFGKIKESIEKRGIQDLQISNEKDLVISGVRGKMMICQWDVAQMAQMMQQPQGPKAVSTPNQPPAPQQPQIVKQVQITLLKDNLAINMTASFPADQFESYYKPFQEFLKSMKIG